MDFRTAREIGEEIDADYEATIFGAGYDHNWCLKNDGKFEKAAELISNESGIKMEVYTDLPGVQFYSGNNIGETNGKNGNVYGFRSGLCFFCLGSGCNSLSLCSSVSIIFNVNLFNA